MKTPFRPFCQDEPGAIKAHADSTSGLWRKWPKPIKLNLENPISSGAWRQGKRLNQANVDSGIPSIEGSDKKSKRQVTNEGAKGINR